MSEKNADITVARQVELFIRQLDSLSTLPCIAAQFLSQLNQFQLSPSTLAELIESDPALTSKIFSLVHQQGLSLPDERPLVRQALDKLPLYLIRDVFLSVKVYRAFEQDEQRALFRKELILHSLAVACCAKGIAEITSPQIDPGSAYLAGLLHNIGNLALDEVMPRSFASIVEEAKSQNACISSIEQKHLGADYTTLGKRLAQKWHFPDKITLAIWLHRSDTEIISQDMPEARIAQVVQLADLIVRQCGIGQSGSYDSPDSTEQTARSLAINIEQLEQVRRDLPEQVTQRSKVLGLDSPKPQAAYCDVIHTTAAQLARDNTKLSLENLRLQTASSHFDFITEFLLSINSNTRAIDAAENFAVRWQKFYQTGPVCLYFAAPAGSQSLEAIVVESPSQTKTVVLNAPAEAPAIPQALQNSFVILDAGDCVDWLFEQLDVDFNLSRTKIIPLLSNGKAVGAIVFELRYPAKTEPLQERFKAATSIAGFVLDTAFTWQTQESFAEQFARFLGKISQTRSQLATETLPKDTKPDIAAVDSPAVLAEMAAGAAHELNNPLSVISGRAQLLAEAETDPEKKQMLKQIRENTNELSAIIDDLMAFARPQKPRPAQTDIKQMLDEAIQLTSQKTGVEHINVQTNVADGLKDVFIDSAQIVSATASIISNSLESYTDKLGPIKITAEPGESGDFIKLEISDLGCGMDAETLQKATQPFFSARPAGRKRGMGLAHAQRIIQLNNSSLKITSRPGSGTTVTILLPCK